MYLKKLTPHDKPTWCVVAMCHNRTTCQVDDFLSNLPDNLAKDGVSMRRLLAYVADQGPQQLPTEISHNIVDDIWQFTKGRLRVLWFYDGGKMVVCCHAFVKKGQKTPSSVIQTAKDCRGSYLLARARNHIEIIQGE